MQLSHKGKIISDFLFTFPKLRFNFEHLREKDDPHS